MRASEGMNRESSINTYGLTCNVRSSRNAATTATSSGSPARRIGMFGALFLASFSPSIKVLAAGVAMTPGAMELALMLSVFSVTSPFTS